MLLPSRKDIRSRGIFILPSIFTLGNLFCGFYAIVVASRGRFGDVEAALQFALAAKLIALSMILDGLDGKIARLAHATSAMGVQLDSLADVVAFGVAPAFLVWSWAFQDLGRLGMAVAFLFTGCGALRLARFNVQSTAHPDNRYFVGLPIPGAASAVAAMVYYSPSPVVDRALALPLAAWTVLLSLLMVSTIRYRSLKQVELFQRRPSRALFWVVLLIAVIFAEPELSLAIAALVYTLHGPLWRLLALLRGSSTSGPAREAGEAGGAPPAPPAAG